MNLQHFPRFLVSVTMEEGESASNYLGPGDFAWHHDATISTWSRESMA